jgi:hypothetical protein
MLQDNQVPPPGSHPDDGYGQAIDLNSLSR